MLSIKLRRPKYLSLEMYFKMLLWANHISISHLTKEYGIRYYPYSKEKECPSLFTFLKDLRMERMIRDILQENQVLDAYMSEVYELIEPFINHLSVNMKYIFSPYLRICPECLKKGRHYIFHQFPFLDNCLVCRTKLEEVCPVCGEKIRVGLMKCAEDGIICGQCGSLLTGFGLPEDMLVSYHDDQDIGFLKNAPRDQVLILGLKDMAVPYQIPELNQALRSYYASGRRPKTDIFVPKDRIIDEKPNAAAIAMQFIEYMDRLTGFADAFEKNGGRSYNSHRKIVESQTWNGGSLEEVALMSLYGKARWSKYYSNKDTGMKVAEDYQLVEGQRTLEDQLALTSIKIAHRRSIIDAICRDWIVDIYEDAIFRLSKKFPDGTVSQKINLNIPTLQNMYLVFETKDAFEISKVPIGRKGKRRNRKSADMKLNNILVGCVSLDDQIEIYRRFYGLDGKKECAGQGNVLTWHNAKEYKDLILASKPCGFGPPAGAEWFPEGHFSEKDREFLEDIVHRTKLEKKEEIAKLMKEAPAGRKQAQPKKKLWKELNK